LPLIVIALAVVIRIAAILILRSHLVPHSTYEHGEIAENLLLGRGFSVKFLGGDGPTSQQAPLYPFCVAVAYFLGGVGTPRALLILSIGQALLSGLLVLGTISLARRIAPSRPWAPILAGATVAFYPTLIYATTHVQVAVLATTLFVWMLDWAYRTAATGRLRDAAVTGALLSFLALTDPILALGFAGVVGAIAIGQRQKAVLVAGLDRDVARAVGTVPFSTGRPAGVSDLQEFRGSDTPAGHPNRDSLRPRSAFGAGLPTPPKPPTSRLGLIATVAIVAGLGTAPWIVRNYRIHGEFVAIKSTFGYAFWQGNSALSQGTDKVIRPSVERVLHRDGANEGIEGWNRTLWAARHEAGYLDDIALTRDDYRTLGAVSEPERSRILFRRALDDLRDQPGRYFTLCTHRLRSFIFFDETNPKSRVLVYRVSHLGLTLLALAGIIAAGSSLRRRLAPTFLAAGLITLFHVMTITSARFHIPLEPLMAIWTGVGLTSPGGVRSPAGSASMAREFVRFRIKRRLGVKIHPEA
jgi:hypothetical protein